MLEVSNLFDINAVDVEKVLPKELITSLFSSEVFPTVGKGHRSFSHLLETDLLYCQDFPSALALRLAVRTQYPHNGTR